MNRPLPIAAHSLFLDEEWNDAATEPVAAFAHLESIVLHKVYLGYRRIMLRGPLPKSEWPSLDRAEPLNQTTKLRPEHSQALIQLALSYDDDIELMVHIGFGRSETVEIIERGAFGKPLYVPSYDEAVETELLRWRAWGYTPYIEGMNDTAKSGHEWLHRFGKLWGWSPGQIILTHNSDADRVETHQNTPGFFDLSWYEGRIDADKVDHAMIKFEGHHHVALDQNDRDHIVGAAGETQPSGLLHSLLDKGCGLMALNNGGGDTRLYERIIELDRRLREEETP